MSRRAVCTVLGMSRFQRQISTEFPIHITARINNRDEFPVASAVAWSILTDYLRLIRDGFGFRTHVFVMMPNHFHLIGRDPEGQMPTAMNYFMRQTSCELGHYSGRINRIWGGPYYSSVMTDPLYYLHAYKYCYRNPVAARLCQQVEDYPWSSLQMLLGHRADTLTIEDDDTLFSSIEPTLAWLNQSYSAEQSDDLKKAFRKKEFKLVRRKVTNGPNSLSNWDSLPRNFTR